MRSSPAAWSGGPPGQSVSAASGSSDGSGLVVLVPALCGFAKGLPPPPQDVRQDDEVVIVVSWYATDTFYLQQHLDAVRFEVRVDRNVVPNRSLEVSDFYTTGIEPYRYGVSIAVPYGRLSPGLHEISYVQTWTQPISDGVDYFGPGTLIPTITGAAASPSTNHPRRGRVPPHRPGDRLPALSGSGPAAIPAASPTPMACALWPPMPTLTPTARPRVWRSTSCPPRG